jgi:hypothetical protein
MKPKLRILGNFHIFLAALGCLLLLTGLMGRIWLNLLIALVLVSGVFAFIRRRRVMVVGAVLALATVAATVIAILVTGRGWAIARQSLLALFLVFTAAVLLQVVLSSGRITLEKLSGAVCVYLLIGAIWASLFTVIEVAAPGSLRFPEEEAEAVAQALQHGEPSGFMVYFSFVTLTTLGYGDIAPLSQTARTLAWAEALLGQLYLTILVARLVGMHISYSGRAKDR